MEFLFNVWKRIREFDFQKMTPAQWVVALSGGVIVLWIVAQLLAFVVGILNFIAPIALVTIIAYFGYQFLQSRSEDIPEEATKSESQKEVEQAIANYRAELEKKLRGEDTNTTTAQASDVSDAETATVVADTEQAAAVEVEVKEEREADLIVAQVVNPETGFKEPDISRLIEHEEKKLAEADKVTDDIMAQIEARRQRLKNQGGDS